MCKRNNKALLNEPSEVKIKGDILQISIKNGTVENLTGQIVAFTDKQNGTSTLRIGGGALVVPNDMLEIVSKQGGDK